MLAARRRKSRHRQRRKLVEWARYARVAGEFSGGFFHALANAPKLKAHYLLLISGAVLVLMVAKVNITINVDILWVSFDTRSGLVAETQIRPVDRRK
jgi:hypothetical protein